METGLAGVIEKTCCSTLEPVTRILMPSRSSGVRTTRSAFFDNPNTRNPALAHIPGRTRKPLSAGVVTKPLDRKASEASTSSKRAFEGNM